MKVLIDTCALFPTVMRETLLGAAAQGFFEPLWSARILEEWARAAGSRIGPEAEVQARGEIALLRASWPRAEVTFPPSLEARLWLPDKNDRHVLAAAISGSADVLLTLNRVDFPRNTLAEEGLIRQDPDSLLMGFHGQDAARLRVACLKVLETARRLSQSDWQMRPLLKKARLPRLAKALAEERPLK